MSRTASNYRFGTFAVWALLLAGGTPALAQEPEAALPPARIVSSEISVSRDQAELRLELANGARLVLSTVSGDGGSTPRVLRNTVSGEPGNLSQRLAISARRGTRLDRDWRELLDRAMAAQADEIAQLLVDWNAPAGGEPLDQALESALAGLEQGVAVAAVANGQAAEFGDSLGKLQNRISELEQMLDETHEQATVRQRHRGPDWLAPLRHIGRGAAGVMSVLVTFAVLFGLGFAVVFFGGRKYLEEVADTARYATGRSFLVGLAASFLVVPAFVLGAIVLLISIVGIPALLVWLPAYPLAVTLAALLGYLAVAHSAGEALAERRFYGGDWFTRANSYYFMLTGLGLLLALFIAAHVVEMAGPWLGFIRGILLFLGVVLTWGAVTTGFGAVLISRAGTRPIRPRAPVDTESFADESL